MIVYMIYNPVAKRYHTESASVWLFMHQNEASIYTNIEKVKSILEEFKKFHGASLEIHTFKMERVL